MTRVGPFDLVESIGQGGMASVWRGVHHTQWTEVAIKIITSRLAHEPRYQSAFRAEIQAAARLHHPGIVLVLDEGQVPADAEKKEGILAGSPYFAMELIEGGTLKDIRDQLDWPTAHHLLRHILEALANAHARGVIHRDLKPQNILLDRTGKLIRPRITDFGIAQALDLEHSPVIDKDEASVTGTPKYMAPEQIAGTWRDQGPWTDLYAIGCLAFWMVCGHVPFDKESVYATLKGHVEDRVPSLSPRFPIPEGLEDWIGNLLEKRPSARFQRAADAIWALERLGPATRKATSSQQLTTKLEQATVVLDDAILPTRIITSESERISGEFDPESLADYPPPAPPIPMSWSVREDSRPRHLHGAGLGLYALRPVPLVGRQQERDILWRALVETHQHQDARAVIVRGPSGVGKSRLIEWFVEHADEVGAARVLRARHGPVSGPLDGLGGTLARELRCMGESTDEIRTRLVSRLRRTRLTDPMVPYDANVLANIASVQAEQQIPRPIAPGDRYAALLRWIEGESHTRPLLFWVDDAQWGWDTLGFCLDALERIETPALFVLTVRDDALAERPQEAARLSKLAKQPNCSTLTLDALSSQEHELLVAHLLGLDESLGASIAGRTRGNPLFAVQLVGSLVERGLLVASESGFVLDGDMPSIPDDLHQVWIERTRHVLGALSERARAEGWRALEIAACLGQEVTISEWLQAAEIERLSKPYPLIEQMRRAHLLEVDVESDEITFVHAMLRESLERHARERGAHASAHRTCATALEGVARSEPRARARYAHHLVMAGAPEEALSPLLDAASWAMEVDDLELAENLLEQRREIFSRLGFGGEHPEQLANEIIEGWIAIRRAQSTMARQLAERVREIAAREKYDRLLGESLRLLGKILRARSIDESTAALEQALLPLANAGATSALGKTKLALGWNRGRSGSVEEGLEILDEALLDFRRADDGYWEMTAVRARGFLLLQAGRIQEAREASERALEWMQDYGVLNEIVSSHSALGECLRHQGHYEEAREHYLKREELVSASDALNPLISRFNIAMVELGLRDYEAADVILDELSESLDKLEQIVMVAFFFSASIVTHAALGRWDDFDADLTSLEERLHTSKLVDRDIIWCLERASWLAKKAAQPERAERARALGEKLQRVSP